MPRVTEALRRISRGHVTLGHGKFASLQTRQGDSQAMSTLRCIQQILLTTVQDEASALLCILLEILQTAEQRKHTGAVNIFLEFTPSGGSSAQSIPFMFGALHSIIVLLCKVNLFLKKNKRLSL